MKDRTVTVVTREITLTASEVEMILIEHFKLPITATLRFDRDSKGYVENIVMLTRETL